MKNTGTKKYFKKEMTKENLDKYGMDNVYEYYWYLDFEDAYILHGHDGIVSIRKKDGLIETGATR